MNIKRAEEESIREWGQAAAQYLRCEFATIASELTETHSWGWVFYFKPASQNHVHIPKMCSVAFDRGIMEVVNIGNKGAKWAIDQNRRRKGLEAINKLEPENGP